MSHSGDLSGSGSSTVQSRPAPAMRPLPSASISAGSSTTLPRATLIRNADGFIRGERLRVDQAFGLRRQRAGERDEIGERQHLAEPAVREHVVRALEAACRDRAGSRSPACRRRCASPARCEPMRPRPTISSVLPPSSSSRLERSEIMPRQWCLAWLSRAKCSWRDIARISDIACSATARALTPCALASRMPAALSASRDTGRCRR